MIRDSQEIILIDKPKGITSFDVIRFLRKKIGFKKMGHAGTLDPLATGLLIVGVGQGTKKLRSLIKLPKTYQASVLLGIKTDTADLAGKVLTDVEVKGLDSRIVRKVVKSLEGRLKLKVPAYSAVKVKGERLYALSRKGKIVSPPEREMVVFKAKFKRLYRLDRHYI